MTGVLHSVSNMDRAGIETMIMNYYRNIDRDKIAFYFLANKQKAGAYEPEITALGGRVYRSPGFNPLKFPKYVGLMKRILSENPDIIAVHAHNGAFGVYALAAAYLCGVKNRIYHAHGTHLPRDFKRYYKWVCKKFINVFANTRLACGDAAAKFFYGNGVYRKHKYTLIKNAIDLDMYRFTPERRERARKMLREKYGVPEDAFVAAHVGRFSFEKNHTRLIDIFAALKKKRADAVLLLVGEGELQGEIADKAKRLGISESVIMTGSVPDVYAYYPAMDAFVMPSTWEGLPVTGVEAQAFGVASVFSKGVTEAVKVAPCAGFMSLDDSDEMWAESILSLAREHPPADTSESLRSAGYDIKIEALRLSDIYLRMNGSDRE